jgi:hypothetical protein
VKFSAGAGCGGCDPLLVILIASGSLAVWLCASGESMATEMAMAEKFLIVRTLPLPVTAPE